MTVSSKPSKGKIAQSDLKALIAGRSRASASTPKQASPKRSGKMTRVPTGPMPAVGDLVSGQVTSSDQRGVFVAVEGSVGGRIKLSDLSARFITGEEASKLFPVGMMLEDMRVSQIFPGKKVELKLKTRLGDPEMGSIHKAIVKRVEKYGVIMAFPNSLMRCLCVTEEVDDDLDACRAALTRIQPGHKYSVKVIRVENGKIWVTMKASEVGESATKFYDQPVMDCLDASEPVSTDEAAQPVELIDEPLVEVAQAPASAKRPLADALEAESSADEGAAASSRKKTKRQRDAAKRERESLIRDKEQSLMSGEWKKDPQTAEEFERLILVEGSKTAHVWIKYMSFWLKMADVHKAREVAERALKQSSLSFADEQEKFNLWIAYLNMESAFGSAADQLFARAAQFCDPKKIYHAMAQVYVRAGQTEKAIAAFERMCSKFPICRKAWMLYVEFLFSVAHADAARGVFAKALKALPAHKATRATVKFGQLEFRSGHAERGATVFEQLLQKNASKTDIWSVFFDETIKACTPPVSAVSDLGAVRALFEKALAAKLKPFKTKFVFKRWLDFETKFGTDEGVEMVKNRAVEYVESSSL